MVSHLIYFFVQKPAFSKGDFLNLPLVWVSFRNSSGFLKVFGDRPQAYPLSMGNFHLSVCLYVVVLPTFILLSLNNYKIIFIFGPISAVGQGPRNVGSSYSKNGFNMVTDSMTCRSWKSSERRNADFEVIAAWRIRLSQKEKWYLICISTARRIFSPSFTTSGQRRRSETIPFAFSGRIGFLTFCVKLTNNSWMTCVLITPVRCIQREERISEDFLHFLPALESYA